MTWGVNGENFNVISTFFQSLEPLYSVDFSTRSFFIIPLKRRCREVPLYINFFEPNILNKEEKKISWQLLRNGIYLQWNISTASFLGNEEKRPCREIDTVERFKTCKESKDVIEMFTPDTVSHTYKGEKLVLFEKICLILNY